jgi:hypothetical protein
VVVENLVVLEPLGIGIQIVTHRILNQAPVVIVAHLTAEAVQVIK